MSARIIDGKGTAQTIREEIKAEVEKLTAQGNRPPGLAVVLVGEDPASQVYTRNKEKMSKEAGFKSIKMDLPADTPQDKLLATVEELNNDDTIDGILVQLPLPPQCDAQAVINAIDPDKDVDGFHPINAGRLATGLPGFVPCTPWGCRELLIRYGIETSGANAVVVGRSNIVGTPMALLLQKKGPGGDATVTVCHSRTKNLEEVCRAADILIAAIGRPEFVKGDWIKEGATVIDVGINRIEDAGKKSGYRLVGDVEYAAAAERAGAITPVPGGVGPMTIAMLLSNTVHSYKQRLNIS